MENQKIKKALFTSSARVGILTLLINSKDELHEAEIVFDCGMSRSSVVVELQKLVKNEIILKRFTSTKTFYRINKKFVYFSELKNIFKEVS